MSTRPRAEIMRDLNTLMAELNHAMEQERAARPTSDESDISPKLEQALEATRQPPRYDEDIKAKARAYKPQDYSDIRADEVVRPEKKERLRDYKQVDDPDWPPDSTWMGTGDQKLIE